MEQAPQSNPPAASLQNDSELKRRIEQLVKFAAAKEATKDYSDAADLYSQASELQSQLYGDMALENADVLYSYGKCLYHVGVERSDVLGGKIAVPAAERGGESTETSSERAKGASTSSLIKDAVSRATAEDKLPHSTPPAINSGATKPLFQFTGDENFELSDDEDQDDKQEVAPVDDEDDDDFANAFEILDMSRLLYNRKITDLGHNGDVNELRRLKERLADTHDLQAEILLEGEKFMDAASDLELSLKIKEELFPLEDPIVAECHYKLSLALEFASLPDAGSAQDGTSNDISSHYDSTTRERAASHMKMAIKSCRARILKEKSHLEADDTQNDETAKIRRTIVEVEDIASDMEQRLLDLSQPPVSIPGLEDGKDGRAAASLIDLEDLSKVANDLSGLVKRKKQFVGTDTPTQSKPGFIQRDTVKRPLADDSPEDDAGRRYKK
ncbi:hypothetical protein FQN57_001178 [Myotisia sp. PD_48]|nr:hypothetical protein FQN57_001178 [Myotisia sp. PD_48]